jgi:TatD DNase family protein
LIDTHCHLNFDSFDEDRTDVIARATAVGVARMILPSVDLLTSSEVIQIAEQHEGIFAAIGVHPNSSPEFSSTTISTLEAVAKAHRKIVAIGEIGLDYYWDKATRAQQFTAFEEQLSLASRLGLPVIIHNREASDDVIAILETWANSLAEPLRSHPGVMHSFSAPQAIAERALAAGFYIGFSGPLTYKKADDIRQVAVSTPLDRILVETDAPFLTPTPYRGKRNEPAYIPLIVERLANLHNITIEAMADHTTRNAERLFGLP